MIYIGKTKDGNTYVQRGARVCQSNPLGEWFLYEVTKDCVQTLDKVSNFNEALNLITKGVKTW